MKTQVLIALLFLTLSPFLTGMGPVDTQIRKIPGGTMVEGSSTTTLEVPYSKFVKLMCEYQLAGELSDDDVIDLQLPVTEALAEELIETVPKDLDYVRDAAQKSITTSNCPTGETKVVGIVNFPWPLRDAWQISNFSASLTGTQALIKYDFLAGTAKESSGYWQIQQAEQGNTLLIAFFNFDIGIRIPAFLIRWAVGRTFPHLFQAMEDYAKEYNPRNFAGASEPPEVTK